MSGQRYNYGSPKAWGVLNLAAHQILNLGILSSQAGPSVIPVGVALVELEPQPATAAAGATSS